MVLTWYRCCMELHPLNNKIGASLREIERFLCKIIRPAGTDCWIWSAYKDNAGYGKFRRHGHPPIVAHRFSYELSIGAIPPGIQIHHKCRNPTCVNPDHLEALTPAEHIVKAVYVHKERTHCRRGHELTPKNTHLYRGVKVCRACARLRMARKANPDCEEYVAFSKLYCKNGHPLFGENMTLVLNPNGGYNRYCKTCRRENAGRYAVENHEQILLDKAVHRVGVIAARVERNKRAARELLSKSKNIPAKILIPTLRRLLRDVE